jgi:hypothetical protein
VPVGKWEYDRHFAVALVQPVVVPPFDEVPGDVLGGQTLDKDLNIVPGHARHLVAIQGFEELAFVCFLLLRFTLPHKRFDHGACQG